MTGGHHSGRHRRGRSPLAWTPRTRDRRDRAHALAEADTDIIPIIDEYPDLPAAGLAKFNLGSIPASVTPPRSTRRAAWFAVTSSALVIVGLVYAAAALVTGPRRPDVVDALPGLPTVPQPYAEPVVTTTSAATPTRSAPPSTTTRTTTSAREPRTALMPTRQAAPASESQAAAPSTHPTRVTVSTPVLVGPATDTEAMGDQTEVYYRQVTEDPEAAHAMTAGELHDEGPDSIGRRYAGIERVEVKSITIDANRGTTRSELLVVREDGTVTSMERELTFTYGSDPKISADSAAS
ncbi:hypothetical protein [Actinokineospora sp. UTMC 2448]|uniref:hypothetical protein n=1 Tax=Actinokineospora sp. UTMC 2448 TaxID=2268449 RepID=UPI0021640C57|nr:hypothetical protein [Actinokineospora sp. UTMC 2448]UVS82069.1 hypothetical protein Actkin_05834 [Actinokineospora sp. UTMC 2448]